MFLVQRKRMGDKIMSRLITFGCSYTYGTGLIDCQDKKIFSFSKHNSKPSNIGWAAQLNEKLGTSLINKSFPGASNFEILYEVLQFDYEENDVIVIMWSHYLRDLFFTKFFKIPSLRRRLGLWKTTGLSRKWVEQMSQRDYIMKSWIYMQHADLYLKDKKIKYIHYPSVPKELNEFEVPQIHIDNLHMDGIDWLDFAEDGSHPGILTNTNLADKIFNIVNE
jgi:hypothetical protein